MLRLRHDPVVAIVGATGAVGREMLAILDARAFPVSRLRLFASPRSVGLKIPFRGSEIACEALEHGVPSDVDLALFSAGKSISLEWAPKFRALGSLVIDNSSAFRADPTCPLVVPEVNAHALDAVDLPAIIANPNCSTIIALVAVTPIHRALGVERMVAATYQAASGAGAAAMAELESQAHAFAQGAPFDTRIFGRQYLFNVFSHNSAVGVDGSNEEERKLLTETRRIWASDSVRVGATCVRVPTLRAHAEALHLELARETSEEEVRALLSNAPGVRVLDDRAANRFPEPLDAAGHDDVLVGRIRMDTSVPGNRGVALFVCGDQIRKGAALNAVQIAEHFLPDRTHARAAIGVAAAASASHPCSR
jgi:aspartate-semialdehyde dehydrogenase